MQNAVCSYRRIKIQMRSMSKPKFYRVIQILLINIAIYFPFLLCNPGCLNYYWKKYISVMCCAILYHLYNLKNVKNTHGGMLLLVKLQALNL